MTISETIKERRLRRARSGRREPRERRHDRRDDPHAPTPDRVADAMRDVLAALTTGEPEVPDVSTCRVLARTANTPIHVGADVTVLAVGVTDGDPEHGALMSDAHVSTFRARFPYECPECPAGVATFDYSRHHNIAGSRSLTCSCGYEHEAETWG